MPPTLADRVRHILEAIESIERLLAQTTQADIAASRHARAILERELEIVSEASRKLPDAIKAKADSIDWRAMAELGNQLRHAYHNIEADILLSIAVDDLPTLKALVHSIIEGDDRK